jgi:hypothetical protein
MSAETQTEPEWKPALMASAAALRRLADYKLPPELDRRLHELGERKESLSPDERAEYLAWIAFTEERSIEKMRAELALHSLAAVCPEVASGS